MKALRAVALAAVAAAVLTGCGTASDPESLHVRCVGVDKLFVLDVEGTDKQSMFVLPDHAECRPGGVLTR